MMQRVQFVVSSSPGAVSAWSLERRLERRTFQRWAGNDGCADELRAALRRLSATSGGSAVFARTCGTSEVIFTGGSGVEGSPLVEWAEGGQDRCACPQRQTPDGALLAK
jgi:hypothetical protein